MALTLFSPSWYRVAQLTPRLRKHARRIQCTDSLRIKDGQRGHDPDHSDKDKRERVKLVPGGHTWKINLSCEERHKLS